MKNTHKILIGVAAVVLGVWALGTAATAQEIEWERFYSQSDPVEGSGTWYSGRHILPMSDGDYVVTSITGSGATAAVARFDSEGLRVWERGITDNDSNLYGTVSFGEQVRIYPRFSYEREDGRIVMFGNEGGSFLASPGYGSAYQLVLDEETGGPLDTLAGWPDSATSLDNSSAVCRTHDQGFFNAQYSSAKGQISAKRLTEQGRFGEWGYRYSIGDNEGQEVNHYPVRVIQTPDAGFVVFGVRQVAGGPGTLFLLKIDSAGSKLWDHQTEPQPTGTLGASFFDTTADGGFVLLGVVSHHDTAAQRKRRRTVRLVKCAADGSEEWSRDYEDTRDYMTGTCVRQSADGGFAVLGIVGQFNETSTHYLDSLDDAFLLKVDGTGNEEWRKIWGGPERENLWFMVPASDGSLIVTGSGGEKDQLYLGKIRIGTAGMTDKQKEAATVMIHPNPARDRLRVVSPSSLTDKSTGVRLYDLLGRDALGRPVPFGSSGVAEIDVSGLPAGAYRAVVEGKEGNVWAVRSVMVVR